MNKSLKVGIVAIICTFTSADFVAAQNTTKKYGEDSLKCLTNISLYRELHKQKNYRDAYPFWKQVVADCPMSIMSIFTEGPVILENLINEEKDTLVREQYLNELFDLFELRIKIYPKDEPYILGRIGVYMAKYRKNEYKKTFEYLDKSIDLSGAESSPQVLDIYFQIADVYRTKDKLSTEMIMDAYDKVSDIMEMMIDKADLLMESVMRQINKLGEDLETEAISQEDYQATYEGLAKDSAKIANELKQLRNVGNNLDIRFAKIANCDMLKQIYGEKIKTNKDERTLRQIVNFFSKQKCTDNEIYIKAIEELHKIKPTAKTAFYMGQYLHGKKKYSDAVSYLKEAAELYEKEAEMIKAYTVLADCYMQLGQYASVRETANKILKLKPNSGIAYILIGDAYMSSVSNSACNDPIPGAVYWVAADKFAKAKAVADDEKTAEVAQTKLSQAAARFPSTNTAFGNGYQKGQSYSVGCWINETTTVR